MARLLFAYALCSAFGSLCLAKRKDLSGVSSGSGNYLAAEDTEHEESADCTECAWRCPAPSGDCGFAEAVCEDSLSREERPADFCVRNKALPKYDVYRSKHCLDTSGCGKDETLGEVCVVTLNRDSGVDAMREPKNILRECGDSADIAVLATQELRFAAYVGYAKKVQGWTLVKSCGGRKTLLSAGVVVLVRDEKRKYIAPAAECVPEAYSVSDGSITNRKGSEVASFNTVLGVVAVASTHGARGDTISDLRVENVEKTARLIFGTSPQFIAWGGDFNPRTSIDEKDSEILRKAGTTRPEGKEASEFSPEESFEILRRTDDIMGKKEQTLDDLLMQISAKGSIHIVQAPGIRDLCPTYPKVHDTGKYEEEGGWFSEKRTVWKPRFACKSENGETEYYRSDQDGETKWKGEKNKSPSWADRILVSSSLSCGATRKLVSPDDHDVLLVNCKLVKAE